VLKEMTIESNQEQTTGKHSYRISKYPSLNYSSLYHSLINLIDVVPLIQTGDVALAQSIIHALACLAPFLPYELLDALPYTFATTLTTFPFDVHKETLDMLCNTLLPINMGKQGSLGGPSRLESSFSVHGVSGTFDDPDIHSIHSVHRL
jgi:hypothetical protein